MSVDKKSLAIGMLLSLRLMGQRVVQEAADATECLFYGVRLHEPPEYDTEAYPCATVCLIDGVYYFYYGIEEMSCTGERQYSAGAAVGKFAYLNGNWTPCEQEPGGQIHWANYHVRNESGTIYVMSSQAYPLYRNIDWCYYGVHILPKLPDAVMAHPYVWLYPANGEELDNPSHYEATFRVYASNAQPKAYTGNAGIEYWGYPSGESDKTDIRASFDRSSMEWTVEEYQGTPNHQRGPAWTNVNAYKLDGTLLCEATEPVPVYE